KDEYGGGVSQVPFLGDLPIVGPLFRTDTRTRTKSNLMVFLRPMVIRSQDESNALSMDRYDLIRAQQGSVGQPRQSVVMPINDAPIAPPATQLAPGSPLQRGQVPPMLALPDNIPVQPKPAQSAPAPAPAPIPGPTSPN
ncbi:MAG: type II secretion system protein GspD, partial [Piscinibacter sp.]|nr:type II secretion system protein GspD [Piscinibacter sp.]